MFDPKKNDKTFVRIVYAKIIKNGKAELFPFKLYANGCLEPNT
jgi:hypothetical protein